MHRPPAPLNDIMAPIRSAIVQYFSLLAGAAVLLLLATVPLREEPPTIVGCYVALIALFVVAHRIRVTKPALAGALCSLGPLVLVTLMVWVRGGILNPAAIASYITLVAVTGLTWTASGTLFVALLSSVILGWFVASGPSDPPYNPIQQWGELTMQLLIVYGVVRLTLSALTKSARAAATHLQRFRDAIEASPNGIMGLDAAGRVQLFNKKASDLSGIDPAWAQGKTLAELNWLDETAFAALMNHLARDIGAEGSSPFEIAGPDRTPLEVNLWSITGEEGHPERLLSFRDITEELEAKQTQEALHARLTHSQSIDALGRLAGGIAHDFNNMLTIISGTSELMRLTEPDGSALNRNLDMIDGAASRAADLTGQLLAFGRKQVLEPRVIDLNRSLEELKPLLQRLIRANIELSVVKDSSLAHVCVDEARLEQVIVNLVSNASEAMPHGGTLILETRSTEILKALESGKTALTPGTYVELVVRDTGIGMDQQTLSHLFEPFFTTKAKGGGTGLGLAMVHGIIAQSGGHISVESVVGQGTSFRILFPPTSAPLPTPKKASLRPPEGEKKARVLLVEDESDVRDATARMLEALGYLVETATDGQDAITRFGQDTTLDAVVSDVIMPNIGGPELAERLRTTNPSLRVLFVSGYTEQDIGSGENGHTQFLGKPFTMRALAEKMRSVLEE